MSGATVRSVSFPIDDVADVQELSEEYGEGSISKLFQALYKSVLAFRIEQGRYPSKDEIGLAVEENKVATETKKETLARMRRERAEARAVERRAKIEKKAKLKAAAPAPAVPKHEPVGERPDPATYEEAVQRSAEWLRGHVASGRTSSEENVEHVIRGEARRFGHEPTKFWRDVRAAARGQTNLLVVPAPTQAGDLS